MDWEIKEPYVVVALVQDPGNPNWVAYRGKLVASRNGDEALGVGIKHIQEQNPGCTVSSPSVMHITQDALDNLGATIQ